MAIVAKKRKTLALFGVLLGTVGAEAAPPIISCQSDAQVFNTAYDGNNGFLTSGNDSNWEVALAEANTVIGDGPLPSTVSGWAPAVVVSSPPGAWYAGPGDWTARWISHAADANHSGIALHADYYYRYQFSLDAAVIPSDFELNIDFFSDNGVHEVYVNDIKQSQYGGLPTGAYLSGNFQDGSQASLTLNQDWQSGANIVVVHIKSDPAQQGYLARTLGAISCGNTPTAASVSYGGTPVVGQSLSGSYSYGDIEGDVEGASTFRWVRNSVNTGIAGGTDLVTTQSYTVASADRNNYLYFCVTPVAATGASPGAEVCSSAIEVQNDAPTATPVTISGVGRTAQVLNGNYTYEDADDDVEGASTFRWVRNSANNGIAGGADLVTTQGYTAVSDDRGNYLYFCVTPIAVTGTSPGAEACSSGLAVINSDPAISNTRPIAVSVNENNTATGVDIDVTDVDGDSPSFSLLGTDSGLFTIDASGAISFVNPPNYETPDDANTDNVYTLTVDVSDGRGGADSIQVTITVLNIIDDDVDGVDSTVEDGVPGVGGSTQGDGNGDGIADSEQNNVTSDAFQMGGTQKWFTIETESQGSGAGLQNINVLRSGVPSDLPEQFLMPYGRFAFEVSGFVAGGAVEVSVLVPYNRGIFGYVKQNQSTGEWELLDSAVVEHFPADSKTRVTFTLTEDDDYDLDSTPNDGVLSDPGGPVTGPITPVPALTVWQLLLLTAGLGVLALIYRKRQMI